MLTWRVEYQRSELDQLSPWPIVTRLYVRAETQLQVPRLADIVFEQIYGSTPAKLSFRLAGVWRAD